MPAGGGKEQQGHPDERQINGRMGDHLARMKLPGNHACIPGEQLVYAGVPAEQVFGDSDKPQQRNDGGQRPGGVKDVFPRFFFPRQEPQRDAGQDECGRLIRLHPRQARREVFQRVGIQHPSGEDNATREYREDACPLRDGCEQGRKAMIRRKGHFLHYTDMRHKVDPGALNPVDRPYCNIEIIPSLIGFYNTSTDRPGSIVCRRTRRY
jgi:hypothetical protein